MSGLQGQPEPQDGQTEAAIEKETVLTQLGGVSGLVFSTLPVLVFVPVNSYAGLTAAIWSALGLAVAILLWRIATKSPVQPAISGFFGVAVCAFIAYRTGDAKGYFLFGIYTSLAYGAVFLVSILARRPLVGIIWGFLNGTGRSWRDHVAAVRAYDVATLAWVLVFVARYLVQSQLYDSDRTGWLAVARIAMGWPLAALAFAITFWAVRRADAIVRNAEAAGSDQAVPDQTDADRT
ncbi:MAG: DUF3159 domain-containing protein [Rhodococcus sp. (in: high G+C Gram-positive bacteria)]